MSPHPVKELDMDRKEELIIAKQLRACRVNILPRNADNCYRINSVSPSPSPRTPDPPSPYLVRNEISTPKSEFVQELSSAMKTKTNKHHVRGHEAQNMGVMSNFREIKSPKILVSNNDERGYNSTTNHVQLISATTNEDSIKPDFVQFGDNRTLGSGLINSAVTGSSEEQQTAKDLQPLSRLPFLNDICARRKSPLPPVENYQNNGSRSGHVESPTILITDVDKLCINSSQRKSLSTFPNLDKNRTDLVQCEAGSIYSQGQGDKENYVTKKGDISKFFTMEDSKENEQDYDLGSTDHGIDSTISKVLKTPSKLPFLNDIHALRKKSTILPTFDASGKSHNSNSFEGDAIENQNVNCYSAQNLSNNKAQLKTIRGEARQPTNPPIDAQFDKIVSSHRKPQHSNVKDAKFDQGSESVSLGFDNNLNAKIPSNVENPSEINLLGPFGYVNKNNSVIDDNPTNSNHKQDESIETEDHMLQLHIDNQKHIKSDSHITLDSINTNNQPLTEKESMLKANKVKTKTPNKYSMKLDEKSSMSRLMDSISPQLNLMQTNLLGLLLFSKLSSNVTEDLIRQQLTGMDSAKLTALILSLGQKVCDSMGPLLVGCMTEDHKTGLLCHLFGNLTNEEKAGILFTSGDDVLETCQTIADFGGAGFKKDLIQNIVAKEDKVFMDDIVYEYLSQEEENIENNSPSRKCSNLQVHQMNSRQYSPADEESFNSCEESLIEEK